METSVELDGGLTGRSVVGGGKAREGRGEEGGVKRPNGGGV